MRVAFYNQMFGLNGRSFFSSVFGHLAVHTGILGDFVERKVNLKKTVEIVKRSGADIVGVCEILQGQEEELERGLRKAGFRYFHFGEGHRTKLRKRYIKTMLASKIKCHKEYVEKEPIENHLGGGGGFIEGYFPSLKLSVLALHLGIKKELREKQLRFIEKDIKKRENMIVMGDFNSCSEEVVDYFNGFNLVSDKVKTCNLTPVMRFFHFEDDDHIFVRGLKKKRIGFLEGRSDHRLIYVDLE